MDKIADPLNAAREKLQEQQKQIEEMQGKVAEFRRQQTAEEIAEMQATSGKIDSSDIIDQRDKLANSDKDLDQVKTAMQHAGPGFGSTDSTVEVNEEEESATEKEASADQPSEPEHVKDARRHLEQTAKSL